MYIIDHKIPRYLTKFRDTILKEYLDWLSINYNKITNNKINIAKGAVGCFVLNFNKNMLSNKKAFGVTLSKNSYSKSRVVNGKNTKRKVSYQYTKSLYNFLHQNSYGELTTGGEIEDYQMIKGKWTPVSFSNSYFKPEKRLKDLYARYVKPKQVFDKLEDVLILRDSKSKYSEEFSMTHQQEGILDFLERYNSFSRTKDVRFKGDKLDTQIYKIFNTDFNHGGRSHMNCEYQRLSSKDRTSVEIEGKKVVCYDYKGFEVSLAYSMNQEIMEMDDPYRIPELISEGYDPDIARKIAKLAIIICLNVDSENDAKLAINKALSDNLKINELYEKGKIPDKTIPVSWVIEVVTENHYIINNLFFSAKGLQVQNVGSAVNDYVLDYMMQNHNQLVIQTHDDFSVIEEYEEELKTTMFKAYEHVLGFNDNCKIEKEN